MSLTILAAEIAARIGNAKGAQARFVHRSGVSQALVSKACSGRHRLSAQLVSRLADALGADDATRARWHALSGHSADLAAAVANAPGVCTTKDCGAPAQGVYASGDPALAPLCRCCREVVRRRMERGQGPASAIVAELAAKGVRARVLVCSWCGREGGRGVLERAPGSGLQCKSGEGCAARRRAA